MHQRIVAHMKKAGPGMRAPGKRGPAMGGPEMAEKILAGMEKRFDDADKNKDGKVTIEEAPDKMKERFAKLLEKYDTDGDKALTKEEGKKYADEMIKKLSKPQGKGHNRGPKGHGHGLKNTS